MAVSIDGESFYMFSQRRCKRAPQFFNWVDDVDVITVIMGLLTLYNYIYYIKKKFQSVVYLYISQYVNICMETYCWGGSDLYFLLFQWLKHILAPLLHKCILLHSPGVEFHETANFQPTNVFQELYNMHHCYYMDQTDTVTVNIYN